MQQKEQKVSIHPYEQSKNATHVCKRCFKPIYDRNLGALTSSSPLCESCINDLSPKFQRGKFCDKNIYWFYEYNEAFRNSLFLLKGCGDYELREIFLYRQVPLLRMYFRNHVIVPAPSYEGRDVLRGFNHVVSIFELLKLPIKNCLFKTADVKQAGSSREQRAKIGSVLGIKNEQKLVGKRILLVDDVLTTGSTIKACIGLLSQCKPKSIDVFVLARVRRP